MKTTLFKQLTYSKILALVIFITVTINSCKEEETPPQDMGFLPLGVVKDYFGFKPGTWWVYENTKTGAIDSQFVIEYVLDTIYQESPYRKFNYESFYLKIFSHTTKNIYQYYLFPLSAYVKDWEPIYYIDREVNYYPLVTEYCIPFIYPFNVKYQGPMPENTLYFGSVDSIFINGKFYVNTCQFQTDVDGTFDKNNSHVPTMYYYSQYYGLVKHQRLDNNESWELVNSNIIR